MYYLQIHPIQSCFLNCEQCPSKPWLLPPDHPDNKMTNSALLKWLDEWCPPHKWFPEILGGEPSLYKGIETLIPEMEKRGYYGMIKTNGLRYVPKSENFPRIACWHLDINNPPKYFDKIIILNNPDDKDRQAKIDYCEDNGISYEPATYRYFWGDKAGQTYGDVEIEPVSFFKGACYIYSNGVILNHPQMKDYSRNIWNNDPPWIHNPCPMCADVRGCETHLTPEMRRKLRAYEKQGELNRL